MTTPVDYRISEEEGRRFAVVPLEQFTELVERAGQAGALTLPHEIISRHLTDNVPLARCWREHLGMTQAELAGRLAVSQAQVAQWERPDTNLRRKTLQKLAAALGIHVQQLTLQGHSSSSKRDTSPTRSGHRSELQSMSAQPGAQTSKAKGISDNEQSPQLDTFTAPYPRSRGLIAGAMRNPPPKPMADHLELYDDKGSRVHGLELLRQMQVELHQMATPSDRRPTATSMAADICISMVCEALEEATANDFSPGSLEYKTLQLAYNFGKLTKPGRSEHRRLLKHMIADMKRQTGWLGPKAVQKQGREWMRAQAVEIWRQDHAQQLLVIDVAREVRLLAQEEAEHCHALGDKGPLLYWGVSLSAIRKNISRVAPPYAQKSGRPRKT